MEWIKVFSPATIGNIGPGFDVLGLAVGGWGDVIEARKIDSGILISEIEPEHDLPTDPNENTAGIAAREVLKLLGLNGGVELKIKKGLPSGSGLGSSAASAAAIVTSTSSGRSARNTATGASNRRAPAPAPPSVVGRASSSRMKGSAVAIRCPLYRSARELEPP